MGYIDSYIGQMSIATDQLLYSAHTELQCTPPAYLMNISFTSC